MTLNTLHALAEAKGILPVYKDLRGNERWTNDESRRALLRAMGVEAATEGEARTALAAHFERENRQIVPREIAFEAGSGQAIPVKQPCEWWLSSESGEEISSGQAEVIVDLPPLKVGVYHLSLKSGQIEQNALVLASPAASPSVRRGTGQDRVWGVTAALYGLRSPRNLGLGDFSDLATFAKTLGKNGASFLGVNPLHNLGWSSPEVISPYSPSHRGFLNTAHIAFDAIAGLEANPEAIGLIAAARQMTDAGAKQVDYAEFAAVQRPLLLKLFDLFERATASQAKAGFEAFVQEGGEELHGLAAFETLAMQHGPDWHRWPGLLKDPSEVDIALLDPAMIKFHMWLQWVASEQLAKAGRENDLSLGLYLDLAVGPRRDGAEVWMAQDSVARGVSLGAPPDDLGPEGQNWQLAAFSPIQSAQTGYRNFRSVLRHTMQHAGVLRIDHILGFNRSFWIPDDGSPGAYVSQPFETLLALIAIEAHQQNCTIIGEDLGLVPEGFREKLSESGLYGYSVQQYEREGDGSFRSPDMLRPQSLACFATHDTPTLRGFCKGRDIDWWQKLGWIDGDKASQLRVERQADCTALTKGGQSPGPAIHERLAGSPAAMVAVQLDDILEVEDAQNLPGTIDEHPNWQRRCALAVDEIAAAPTFTNLAKLMEKSGRAHSDPDKED